MYKKFLSSLVLSSLITLQAWATEITLGQVLKAAPKLSNFESSNSPLQFGEPIKVGETTCRWFFYNNTQNPDMTFGDMLTAEKRLDERFNTDGRLASAMFIQATDEEKKKGISYILSLNNPHKDGKGELPTVAEVLKASDTLRHYKPSPLVYPASPESVIELDGVKYQIRYCMFHSAAADHVKRTLGRFVEVSKLEKMAPQVRNDGYGEYLAYILMDKDGAPMKDPRMVVSMAKVE